MAEPTGVMTFADLIIEVAVKLGIAYHGANGDQAPQVPTDAHDLSVCKRIVNKGIRMFIHDGPLPNGWRWLRPVAQLDLWPTVSAAAANVVTSATHASGVTTIVVTSAAFYPSMELKTITIDATDYTIASYISATSVTVTGDASAHVGDTFSIEADGNYTLPLGFGGQVLGQPTYVAGTDRGSSLEWCDESVIRNLRSNADESTGTPSLMATRVMTTGSPRRRWEALMYRTPGETLSVLFPYVLHFDSLVETTEVSPAPFGHDETVKAACLATAEKDQEDRQGADWDYYRTICLPNSYRVDAMSAPRKLGNFGPGSGQTSIRTFRDRFYQRPEVSFNQ